MHIYTDGRWPPPSQLSMDQWKTTTLNKFHGRLTPPLPPIEHRSMEDHYTTEVSHRALCTDT